MSMQFIRGNTYDNPYLGLTLVKPDSWHFIPVPWATASKEETFQNDEEFIEILRKCNKPIFYITDYHDSNDEVYPTVQAVAYINTSAERMDYRPLLEQCVTRLKDTFEGVRILNREENVIFAGYRALYLRASYLLVRTEDGYVYRCQARIYIVITPRFIFTFSFSGPGKGKYKNEKELDQIMASIRIL